MAAGPEQLLTVAEVAAKAAVSAKTVRREIDRGELVANKIGRCVRITREAYDAWIAKGQVSRAANSAGTHSAPASSDTGSLARLRMIERTA